MRVELFSPLKYGSKSIIKFGGIRVSSEFLWYVYNIFAWLRNGVGIDMVFGSETQ